MLDRLIFCLKGKWGRILEFCALDAHNIGFISIHFGFLKLFRYKKLLVSFHLHVRVAELVLIQILFHRVRLDIWGCCRNFES